LDAELSRLLGDATCLEHGASFSIKVEVKLRGFIDCHVSIQEFFRADRHLLLSRRSRNDRPPLIRPAPSFILQDLSRSLQDENEIDTCEPAPGQSEFEISNTMAPWLQEWLQETRKTIASESVL